jgi:hypothetical protein
MARMPGADWVGEQSPKRAMARYDIVCVHTIVGFAPAHAAHFSVHSDGRIEQSRDTRYQSAANLDGNHRVIAIENEDMGGPFPNWGGDGRRVPPLTDAQVEANARILRWAHETHGIPLQLCPNSKPGSRGLAYHRQGIDGNFGSFEYPGRVAGGEVWTEHFGKVCPGDARIAQLPDILRLAKGDDMAVELDDKLWPGRDDSPTVRDAYRRMWLFVERYPNKLKRILEALDELDDKISSAATKGDMHRLTTKIRDLATEDEEPTEEKP